MRDFAPAHPVGWSALTLRYDGPGVVDARLVFRFEDGTELVQHLAKTGRNAFFGLVRPPRPLASLAVAVSGSAALAAPPPWSSAPCRPGEQRRALLRRALAVLRGDPRSFPWRLARFAVQMSRSGRTAIPATTAAAHARGRLRAVARALRRAARGRGRFHRGRLARLGAAADLHRDGRARPRRRRPRRAAGEPRRPALPRLGAAGARRRRAPRTTRAARLRPGRPRRRARRGAGRLRPAAAPRHAAAPARAAGAGAGGSRARPAPSSSTPTRTGSTRTAPARRRCSSRPGRRRGCCRPTASATPAASRWRRCAASACRPRTARRSSASRPGGTT